MDSKYPHWYAADDKPDLCDCTERDMCCDDELGYKVHAYQVETLKDRILCMLGNEVLFSTDARICRRETFCGVLCYVGCDFIIVNVSLRRCPVSMHIPLKMLRFIAPFKSHRSIF